VVDHLTHKVVSLGSIRLFDHYFLLFYYYYFFFWRFQRRREIWGFQLLGGNLGTYCVWGKFQLVLVFSFFNKKKKKKKKKREK
jgi:hypothetical protein